VYIVDKVIHISNVERICRTVLAILCVNLQVSCYFNLERMLACT